MRDDSDDLLAGVRLPPRRHSAVRVAPDTWMRVEGPGTTLLALACWFLSVITGFGALSLALVDDMTAIERLAFTLFLALGAVALGAVALWRTRAGLRISPQGVRLRGVLRSHDLSLSEVEEFVPGSFSLLPLTDFETGVRIVRRGGGDLDVWATVGAARGEAMGPESMQPLCDELNGLLRSMKEGQSTPSSAARMNSPLASV